MDVPRTRDAPAGEDLKAMEPRLDRRRGSTDDIHLAVAAESKDPGVVAGWASLVGLVEEDRHRAFDGVLG